MARGQSHGWSSITAVAIVFAALVRSPGASAQERMQGTATPSTPITRPYGFVAPTPAPVVTPWNNLFLPNGENQPEGYPPFDRPLPPSIQLPPPIRVLPAVPPPFPDEIRNPADWVRTVPALPGRPAPTRLPERPDEVQPPAGDTRQSLSELDRRVGLGGAGPVITAARQIAQSEWVTGRATLEIMADREGRIRSVRVVEASRDTDGWLRYGQELRTAQQSGMRLPEEARGIWMLLEVRIDNELSSGHRNWWAPGLVFFFDLADVNARRLRTVHTQVLSEVWF
jgi:hypothetical protein